MQLTSTWAKQGFFWKQQHRTNHLRASHTHSGKLETEARPNTTSKAKLCDVNLFLQLCNTRCDFLGNWCPDRPRGKYSLTKDSVACGRGLLKALRTAVAICWRVYPATSRRSPPAAPKVSVKIRENVTKKTDFNISTFHQRPRNQPKAEGSGHTHTKSRWFIKNYQTIIKQLSNNYQTTIKQLSNN